MRNFKSVEFVILVCALSVVAENRQLNSLKQADVEEDSILTVPQLITKYGYPIETHNKIITEDGYILTMHRIPHARNSSLSADRPVVFIQGGFTTNSAVAVLAGPDKAIGYIFADSGYDVWIGNSRGTRYSTKHVSLSQNKRQYWEYSWSDIGYYDIPAMVDYILKMTGQKKLYYIGHSRGTTSFYVMCSTRPEYNNKIRAMASMAPVAYLSNIPNPFLKILFHSSNKLQKALKLLGINSFVIAGVKLARIGYTFCRPNKPTFFICEIFAKIMAGFDNRFNTSLIPILVGHVPDRFSVKELVHYEQLYHSDKFRNYDYGFLRNLIKYNSSEPPNYDLSKVTAPVALYYSANDWLSSVADTERLYKELGNPVVKNLLPDGPNHYGYLIGINMKTYLYDKILELFKKY